ncbi:MAG: sugar phosphate isomerase/epimerase family protein [Anaerolineae bacterium]
MIALSSGSLYTYGLDRVFNLASDIGFDGLELMVDQRWDTRQADYLRQLMNQYQLPILAVHSPFVAYVPGWPRGEPARIKQTTQLAEGVGARIVVAHLPRRLGMYTLQRNSGGGRRLSIPVPWSSHAGYRRWLMNDLVEFQASTGVTIAIENMPAWRILGQRVNTCHWNDIQSLEQFSHLTLDTTHLGTWGIDPVATYDVWGERVAHVHLSNFNGAEHRLLDDGHLRLDRLLEHLASAAYDGVVTLEFNPGALQAESERQVRGNLGESLAFCRDHFG